MFITKFTSSKQQNSLEEVLKLFKLKEILSVEIEYLWFKEKKLTNHLLILRKEESLNHSLEVNIYRYKNKKILIKSFKNLDYEIINNFLKKLLLKDWFKIKVKEEKFNNHLKEIKVNEFIYHKWNPLFRDIILKEGLKPQSKSDNWLSDTNIKGKVLFATNSSNKEDWFDSWYDDDVYEIKTCNLKNKWFEDPNFQDDFFKKNKTDDKHIITFDYIPVSEIKLIYKGSWENLD